MDELSFCLWKGSTILDTLAFCCMTTLFSIFLLSFFVLAVNQRAVNDKLLFTKFKILNKFRKVFKKIRIQEGSIIHGVSAFLILSYTQYTLISMQILNKGPIYTKGGRVDQNVAYLQGNLRYFGVEHLPHAIPAVLVLFFLSLPPPLVLIAYPLLWKIKANLRRNSENDNETTPWLIRKLLPLIDSFQGVFKDNFRMFAGLFFLWRFILAAISIFASTLWELFLPTEITLVIIFASHALVRPYKHLHHNIIDGIMLVNMIVTTLLKWYTSVPQTGNTSSQVIEFIIYLQLLFMYMPLVVLGGYCVYWLMRGYIKEKCNCPKIESRNDNEKKVTQKKKQQGKCADEELFSRAAELNSLSVNVTSSEVGVDLDTYRTTTTAVSTN